MALGKRGYASLPLDGRPEQTDDIGILENVCVPSEITLGKKFMQYVEVRSSDLRLRRGMSLSRQKLAYVYYENGPGRRSAANTAGP